MEDKKEKIIVFRAYDSVMDANLAKIKLDAYDIPCFLTDENITNLYGIRNAVFPGARLHIFQKDFDEVRALLDEHHADNGFIKCPRCGSYDHEPFQKSLNKVTMIMTGIMGVLGKDQPSYRCQNCDHVYSLG